MKINPYLFFPALPPKIDPSVTMMQVEEKPDVTYEDVGGVKEELKKLREVKNNISFLIIFYINNKIIYFNIIY